jgi:secreted PhoX family phosphatase
MRRRDLLSLLGVAAGGATGAMLLDGRSARTGRMASPVGASPAPLPFRPVPLPLPVGGDGLTAAEQQRRQQRFALEDRLVLPEGYTAELLAVWGDRLGGGRFGFNNDHVVFTPLGGDRALLTINFEYISGRPWREGHATALGAPLPLDELEASLAERNGRIELSALAADDPLAERVRAVATAALEDLGIGVMEIRRDGEGRWRRSPGGLDRRITGLEGLRDPSRRLQVSGPAAAVFRRRRRRGHDDGLGSAVIGSFANCAGGETPWGTVLSAEENVQSHVCEEVFADGSSPHPSRLPFRWDGRRLEGLGNPFGLAGNKYGWVVELDPRRPERPAVKHSWLGRFRHEAVAVRAEADRPLLAYSGCDRHGGHLYRFVSRERVNDPADPDNSRLFTQGRLEVARLDPDGRGRWIPLAPETPVQPLPPGHFQHHGMVQPCLVPHSDRNLAGAEALADDAAVAAYRRRYPTLADLYPGEGEERMGAILIDAHLAANAVGATPAARPEDTVLDPGSGDLLIAFTSGGSEPGEGSADPALFRGPQGETPWPHGWVLRLRETGGGRFRWRMVASGGPPWQGGLGFSHPDNLMLDRRGNLWLTTDRGAGREDLDVFGNNSCWLLPADATTGAEALCFATAPIESELCGPCLDGEESTLFLAVQHPGEAHGTRRGQAEETRRFRLVDRDGRRFVQERRIPLGSNWPAAEPGSPPRPGLVAIRRHAGGPLLGA